MTCFFIDDTPSTASRKNDGFKPYYVAHTKIQTLALLDEQHKGSNWYHWRVIVDGRRTLQPIEIPLLIKINRKRGVGWLIALGEPIFTKPTKTKEPIHVTPYYDYVI